MNTSKCVKRGTVRIQLTTVVMYGYVALSMKIFTTSWAEISSEKHARKSGFKRYRVSMNDRGKTRHGVRKRTAHEMLGSIIEVLMSITLPNNGLRASKTL